MSEPRILGRQVLELLQHLRREQLIASSNGRQQGHQVLAVAEGGRAKLCSEKVRMQTVDQLSVESVGWKSKSWRTRTALPIRKNRAPLEEDRVSPETSSSRKVHAKQRPGHQPHSQSARPDLVAGERSASCGPTVWANRTARAAVIDGRFLDAATALPSRSGPRETWSTCRWPGR